MHGGREGEERDAPRLLAVRAAPVLSTDWQDARVSAVAPAGAIQVTMLVHGTRAAAGVSYWDEVRLAAAPAPYGPVVADGRELFVDSCRMADCPMWTA